MRKKILLLALMALVVFIYGANAIDMKIVWNNDLYRFGIGSNNDDGMTGGVDIELSDVAGRFSLAFSGYSYTDRGFKRQSDLVQGRTDVMNLSAGYLVSMVTDCGTNVDFNFYLGVEAVGDLGLSKIQDRIHESMTYSYHLNLPYPEKTYFAPSFKMTVDVDSPIGGSNFSLVSHTDIGSGKFESCLKEDIEVSLADMMYLKCGFSLSLPDMSDPASFINTRMTTGATVSFGVDAGGFGLGYVWYPFSFRNYGLGSISIKPLEFFRESSWNESDISVSASLHYQYGRKGYANSIEYGMDKCSIVLKEAYSTGFPLTLTDGEEWDWNGSLYRKNWTILTMDARKKWAPCRWIELYGEAGIGLGVFRFEKQTYPSNPETSSIGDLVTGIADFCGGLTILPEGVISTERSSFRLNVYGGISVNTASGRVENLFTQVGTELEHPAVETYFGFGLTIGLDV